MHGGLLDSSDFCMLFECMKARLVVGVERDSHHTGYGSIWFSAVRVSYHVKLTLKSDCNCSVCGRISGHRANGMKASLVVRGERGSHHT